MGFQVKTEVPYLEPDNLVEKPTADHQPPTELTYGGIAGFYIPLALSWVFMSIEAPLAIGLISRLPNATANTAAFLIMMGLALWIESPVIDLLSTSTTLAKDRERYVVLSKFVWALIFWVTAAHALFALSPAYIYVTHTVLKVPAQVAIAARPGLIIMIPWSGFIGWRRYLQGILIRFNQTRFVGLGTLVRVSTILVAGLSLYQWTTLPGINLAAIALIASVALEALFIHWASRRVIRERLDARRSEEELETFGIRKLLSFHLPLTATTMIMMVGTPVVSAALSRSPDGVTALAAWQVCATLLWLHRTITFALPEVVITLYRDLQSQIVLQRFCIGVGILTSGLLLLMAFSGGDRLFFTTVLGAKKEIAEMAHIAFLAGALLPFIGALQSYVRGLLTALHRTVARFMAVVVSMACLIALLRTGIAFHITGVLPAGIALTLALTAELFVLVTALHKRKVGPLMQPHLSERI